LSYVGIYYFLAKSESFKLSVRAIIKPLNLLGLSSSFNNSPGWQLVDSTAYYKIARTEDLMMGIAHSAKVLAPAR
jgi:hypothetical protein